MDDPKKETEAVKQCSGNTVKRTRRKKEGSFSASVVDLQVGVSVSRATEVPKHNTLIGLCDLLSEMKIQMRNNCAPAIKYAKDTTGGTYSLEAYDSLAPSGRLFIIAVVTRLT